MYPCIHLIYSFSGRAESDAAVPPYGTRRTPGYHTVRPRNPRPYQLLFDQPMPPKNDKKATPKPPAKLGTSRRSSTDNATNSPATRTRAKSESDRRANGKICSTPTNPNQSLSNSILPDTSTLSASQSEATNRDGFTEETKKKKITLKDCPCLITTGGEDWLLKCSQCSQHWHISCVTLRGLRDLTKDQVTRINVHWQCPWCFNCPIACPSKHKSAKMQLSLNTTVEANNISSTVLDSLEGMVSAKLEELTKPTTTLIGDIQNQLSELTVGMKALQSAQQRPPGPIFPGHFAPPGPRSLKPPGPLHQHPQPHPSQKRRARIDVEDADLQHDTKHIDALIEDYISEEEEQNIMTFFETEDFVKEGRRGVVQYGEYYTYMGSKTKPKKVPNIIQKIMDRLNESFCSPDNRNLNYKLDSCLVNRFDDCDASIPEHADDEGDINVISSIFTISLGDTRTVTFRDLQTEGIHEVECRGRSLYHMTRRSQNFFKHSVKPAENISAGVRYSLTFRAIHWSNFNSTALVGDSNFKHVRFGSGKGNFGASTPGVRSWAPTIDKIDPLACTSFKNVVVMVGTNDLKDNNVTDESIITLYKSYKTKISLIRKYNARCKLYVCPVLPSKSHSINRKVNIFNDLIYSDLCQTNLTVTVLEGFDQFLDKGTNLLKSIFAEPDDNDILHLGKRGVKVLVSLIKFAIFSEKGDSNRVGRKLYANTLRGGPTHPV